MIGWLSRTREQRSIENPQVPLTGQNIMRWLGRGLGRPTAQAKYVDEQSAMTLPAAFACIKVIGETGGTAPIDVFRRTKDGHEKTRDHPNYAILHERPNDEQTPAVWREQQFAHTGSWGNGYSFIERDRGARPRQLRPLDPSRTSPERKNGTLRYAHRMKDGKVEYIDPADIIHVPGLGFNGLQGFSPIALARNAIGLGLEAEQFNAKIFENGAFLSGVLQHPAALSDKAFDRLMESVSSKQGLLNAYDPMILEEGMTWNQMTLPKSDVFFLLLQKFTAIQVCRIYRIPPHLIGETDNTNYNNMTELNRMFMTHTMAIYFKKFEDELNRKLFAGTEFFCEFNLKLFLRADPQTQAEIYKIASGGPWMAMNEIRRAENLNARPGGDVIQKELNQAYLDEEGNVINPNTNEAQPVPDLDGPDTHTPEPDTSRAADRERFGPVLERSARALTQKVCDRARAASRKHGGFGEWVTEFFDAQIAHECDVLGGIAFAFRGDATADEAIAERARARCARLGSEAIAAHADGAVGVVCDAWQRNLPAEIVADFFEACAAEPVEV